jgi:hypothetical protein
MVIKNACPLDTGCKARRVHLHLHSQGVRLATHIIMN